MSDQIQPWPLVKRGSQGHPVPALQYLLRDRGHHVTVDGIFGPKTEAAVEQFQTADQLPVDGIVGPQTWGALVIVLARGSTGDAVRGLQEEFRFRDQSSQGRGLAVDGIFGPKTATAVRSFQQALGITVDGIVGPLTWRALVSGMLSF
ncbi:MAG TPA: peptidoglycan-binding protein [Streptosporangiaceae bacterium]|jgi:peptidoglycan hydrolase-like protein with peptidoglycan-binding domain|nr:peptidoglycan-binding protein [Streptosporangiaceae bacterium]